MKKFLVSRHINYALNEYQKNGVSDFFKQLCQEVIDSRDPRSNYLFAKTMLRVTKEIDVLAHGRVVLEYGDAEANYDFARTIKGADCRAHRDKIIELGSVEYNIYAGKSVELKDSLAEEYVNKHGQVILDKGGFCTAYQYIRRNKVEGLNKQPYLDKIIATQDPQYNLKTAQNVEGIDIEPHSKIVAQYGDAEQNFLFLAVAYCNAKRHLNAIIKSGDPVVNLRCLIEVKDCNYIKHMQAVFDSNNNECKYEAVMWANRKGYLREFNKYVPAIKDFVQEFKAGNIKLTTLCYKFLKSEQAKER